MPASTKIQIRYSEARKIFRTIPGKLRSILYILHTRSVLLSDLGSWFSSRVSKMVPGSPRAWVSVSRLFHGILCGGEHVVERASERAEVNRLSMGISGRWTSVGLGTRGVSLGTDASLRTTRADAGVAVASAAVAVSCPFPFSLSLSLSASSRLFSFAQLVSILAYLRIAVPRVVAASLPFQKSTRPFSSYYYYYFHASPV